MKENAPQYKRLFQRKIGSRHGGRVYTGDDHLLITNGVLVERFNRVFYNEIESIEVQPSNRRLRQVFFALVGFFLVEGLALAMGMPLARRSFFLLGLFPLGYAVAAYLRGPTVHFFLNTRVSRIPVACVSRWGHAVKMIRKVEDLVEPVQGPGWYADPSGRDGSRIVAKRAEMWKPTVEGAALVACLGGCTLCLLAALLQHWIWALAAVLPLLVIFTLSLLCLIRNRLKDIPVFVNGWLWLLFVFSWLVLNWGLAIGGAVSTFHEVTSVLGQSVDRNAEGYRLGTQFFHGAMYGLAAGFLLLAIIGGAALGSRETEPNPPEETTV